ncbi:hypothetical protein FOZ62_029423, partial [Perkinsus olseni]
MFQRALFDYSMTIRLEPTASKHYGCRAECFKKLGRVADCLKDYTEAVRHEKGGGRYIFERAMVHFEVGDHSAAAQDITTALSKECANPFRAYLCRGICHRHNKGTGSRHGNYESTGSTGATDNQPCKGAAGVNHNCGRPAKAWGGRCAQKHTSAKRDVLGASQEHGFHCPDSEVALKTPDGRVTQDGCPEKSKRALSGHQQVLHNLNASLASSARGVQVDGVTCPCSIGELCMKDIGQSVDDLNKAIELNSADTDAHDHLGLSLLLSRDYKGALGAFTKAVAGCTTPAEDDRKA